MKKYSNKFLFLILSLLMFACGEELLVEGKTDFTSGYLFSPDINIKHQSINSISINDFVALGDLSVGVKSSEWTISSGNFLKSTIRPTDSLNASAFIDGAKGKVTNDKIISVLFDELKMQTITYKGVYEKATLIELDGTATNLETVENENGEFVFENEYKFDVYGNPVPAYKIFKGTEEVFDRSTNEEEKPQITLEAGESLTFVDLNTPESIGRPDSRKWSFTSGNVKSSNAQSVEINFNALGLHKLGRIEIKRSLPEVVSLTVIDTIPLLVNVIKSSKPLINSGRPKVDIDGVISFQVLGEVLSVEGQENKFTVNVENTAKGFNKNIAVESVSINAKNASIVELRLSEEIYDTDDITISYVDDNLEDNDGIVSVDGRTLQNITPITFRLPISSYEGTTNKEYTGYELVYERGGGGNEFKLGGFKNGTYFAQNNDNFAEGNLYFFRDNAQVFEGENSLKFETPETGIPTGTLRIQGTAFGTKSPITKGHYIPAIWIYIDPATIMSTIEFNLFKISQKFIFDISMVEKGKWVHISLPAVDVPDYTEGRLDINIRATGQDSKIVQKLWLDNFDLLKINDRP